MLIKESNKSTYCEKETPQANLAFVTMGRKFKQNTDNQIGQYLLGLSYELIIIPKDTISDVKILRIEILKD